MLIPDTGKAVRGTLQSDDGARRCELEIPATGDKAICPPQPLQNNVGQQNGSVQPPATQPPATQPSVTQPPVTQPPAPTDAQMAAQIAAGGPELLIKPPPINQSPTDQVTTDAVQPASGQP